MGKRVIKNYPSPKLMSVLGVTSQTISEAIGELVANCFDARVENEKVIVTVEYIDDKIIVIDNGTGMTSGILEKALCIGEDMSNHMLRIKNAKGRFGMGFKTSCAVIGRYYEIYTRPYSENREYHVEIDIDDYGTRPYGINSWDVVIEDGEPSDYSPLKGMDHGTAFVISRLKYKNIIISAVLNYLGEAYKEHILTGDSIYVMDKTGKHEVIPRSYSLIPNSKIDIDEFFGPEYMFHITGWMGLDTVLHNDGRYGFTIYRNRQLVDSFNKTWFKAHLMTSRIIGEVNMDFLGTSFCKPGIQQSEDWFFVSEYMREYLKGIVGASRQISKSNVITKKDKVDKIIDDLNHYYFQKEIEKKNYLVINNNHQRVNSVDFHLTISQNCWLKNGDLYTPYFRLDIVNQQEISAGALNITVKFFNDNDDKEWGNISEKLLSDSVSLRPGVNITYFVKGSSGFYNKLSEELLPDIYAKVFINDISYGIVDINKSYDARILNEPIFKKEKMT